MEKHFKFTGKTKVEFGITFNQIQAIKNLPCGVKRGDIGGWIESKHQLYGNAWVYENAKVSGNA